MLKEIKDFENYLVDENGNIYSKITNKYLKKTINYEGYEMVGLYKNKRCYTLRVHRLVAIAFIPNPNNYDVVNHKDENKTNNCVSNLEWTTPKDNVIYSQAKKVAQIKDGKIIKIFSSAGEADRELKCSRGKVSQCCRGVKKSLRGFNFTYVY